MEETKPASKRGRKPKQAEIKDFKAETEMSAVTEPPLTVWGFVKSIFGF